MESINFLAVLVAAASAFLLGGAWYSRSMFGSTWNREAGIIGEDEKPGHGAVVFGMSFLLSLIAATVLALFLGTKPQLGFAIGVGFSAGLFWVTTSFSLRVYLTKVSKACRFSL